MTQEEVRQMYMRRLNLQNRIKELGGVIPSPWPWADHAIYELQLTELVEDLERKVVKQAQAILSR